MILTQTKISQLYVSIFGRASEGEGNSYWQTQGTISEVASKMLATDAAQTYFGTSLDSDQDFIEHIYLNTLGKTYAEDTAGVDYWVSQLTAGTSRGDVVANLITAAQSAENAGAAQDQFNNKVAVSDYVADTIESAEVSDLSDFTRYIADITDDEDTVTAIKADIEESSPDEIIESNYILTALNLDIFEGTSNFSYFPSYTSVDVALKLDVLALEDVVVNYSISPVSTADKNEDYSGLLSSGRIIFDTGTSSNNLTFDIIQDSNFEQDEIIQINFSGNNIENTTSTVIIKNDDSLITQEEYYIDSSGTTDASSGDYKFLITPDNYTHTIYNLDKGDTLKYNSNITSSSTSIINSTGTINYTDGLNHTTIELVNVINYDPYGDLI